MYRWNHYCTEHANSVLYCTSGFIMVNSRQLSWAGQYKNRVQYDFKFTSVCSVHCNGGFILYCKDGINIVLYMRIHYFTVKADSLLYRTGEFIILLYRRFHYCTVKANSLLYRTGEFINVP